ncbi:acyl transferase/acyl hydrolase/lysophospholipase [Pyrenochaeta sp. MPI-SDFR-AT-0127]|nr:acyl transferase/acyl hydrolase/lysophospholipase [Pyrenochaeta sp. MPI-SDFR-AT-0127]
MSGTPVDFSRVRYSPIEGTHYFYDPASPSTIQFLLSGTWESWDVGWVKYKAQDPDIRRLAEETETRLLQDPLSGYCAWPSTPPPGPPPAPPHGGAQPSRPAESLNPLFIPELVPLSPRQNNTSPLRMSISRSPQDPDQHSPVAGPSAYSSPYRHRTSSNVNSTEASAVPSASPPDPTSSGPNVAYATLPSPPRHEQAPQRPTLQPAAPARVVLSRTRETKILLSIDGDGIRGLSSLLVIESLVNAICVKIGQRLDPYQIFDLTGGSSLGGIIAIMLCRLRMQPQQARESYKRIAKQAYLNKKDFFVSLDPHAPKPNVDGVALEFEIKSIVQKELNNQDELLLDGRDDSDDVFVISTHIEIGSNKPALMRSYQTRRITGPELDTNMPIWKAMHSTCVAPRYMPPQPGINQRLVIQPGLVDHGTAKNNPIRDILYECRKLFRYANDMMIIVSIGTGIGIDRSNEISEMVNSVEERQEEARAWGEKFEQEHAALMERNWMKYFRFNVPGLESVPLEEWCNEELIKEKTSEYLSQPEVGRMFYNCVDAITGLLLGPPGR